MNKLAHNALSFASPFSVQNMFFLYLFFKLTELFEQLYFPLKLVVLVSSNCSHLYSPRCPDKAFFPSRT